MLEKQRISYLSDYLRKLRKPKQGKIKEIIKVRAKNNEIKSERTIKRIYRTKVESIQTDRRGFPGSSDSKDSACSAGDPGSIPGQEDPLEKGMATHSSSQSLGNIN